MYSIGHVIFEDEMAGERFACDINRCQGKCCTMYGERGAPLIDEEVDEIEKNFPQVVQFLPAKHLEVIRRNGTVAGSPGDYSTVCVDRAACVFVYYQDNTARCAFEKAFFMGLTQWQKPLSCHLFPIRVRRSNPDRLYYERIHECMPGREHGMILNIPLIQFLKDALVRKYGLDWYKQALSECRLTEDLKDIIS